MGVKTIVDSKGVYSVKGAPANQLDVQVAQVRPIQFSVTVTGASATLRPAADAVLVLKAPAAGLTASLPTVTTTDVGKSFFIMKSGSLGSVLVSGTLQQPILASGPTATVLLTSNWAGVQLIVVPLDIASGVGWHMVTRVSGATEV